MSRSIQFTAVAVALLLAAACGTSNNDYPILGGGSSYPSSSTSEIRGTVDSVDLTSRSIYLTNVSNYSTNLYPSGGGGGSSVRVFYDDRTTVSYNGKNYRPEDLERGDQVSVRVDRSANQLLAQSMDVLYNAGGMASSSVPHGNGSVIHATIRSIDNYARTMTVDPGNGSRMTITYAANTPVYYNNRTYGIADLEVGDQMDVRVNDLGGGRFSAQDITVTRNVSGSTGTPGSQYSTVRGTVRYVDPSTTTIVLDSPSWASRFSTNPGNSMTIRYNSNAQVSFQGKLYPVTNLERGDIIEAQVQDLGNGNFVAQNITVVRNVNAL